MTVALILAGLVTSGVFSLVVSVVSAPVGYQDETGFHVGKEPKPAPQK
ncbi:MAG: hypothetical protein MUC91_10230 [Verrucomicrobia bacterium]|nr:hypothetical protein [Verrucomicrobiota bacterium]